MQAKQNKEFIHCFPLAGRCSAIPRKAGLHHMSRFLGKTNTITPNALFSFFPQLLLLSTTSYGMEHPSAHLGSAVLAVSPPSSLCTPSLLTSGAVWGAKQPWCCTSTAQQELKQPCVLSIVFSRNLRHSIIRATVKKSNAIPAKTSAMYYMLK